MMEDLVNDEGLDLEALRAQIDLSLAQTQNLVATWLKPSKSASAGSSRINQEKDIQELLKRPPRLGVGAPIPASTGTLGHETMKLKGKLVSKKRTREVEDIGTKTADQSDDEEESRAGAIKKKARVDPFAAKGKKKQTGNNSVQNALPTKSKPSPPHTPPRATSPSAEAQADATVVEPPNKTADEVSSGSPSKKTKKKKKHKDGNKEDKEAEDTVIGQERGATTSPTKVVTKPLSTADQHRDSTPPRGGFHKTEDPVPLISVPETPRVSTSTPQTTQAKETATPKPTGEASGLPLLNLEGPPPTLSLEASPAKKKRKRNRKKKKKQSEGGGQAHQSADHDAEPQDEEEEDE